MFFGAHVDAIIALFLPPAALRAPGDHVRATRLRSVSANRCRAHAAFHGTGARALKPYDLVTGSTIDGIQWRHAPEHYTSEALVSSEKLPAAVLNEIFWPSQRPGQHHTVALRAGFFLGGHRYNDTRQVP